MITISRLEQKIIKIILQILFYENVFPKNLPFSLLTSSLSPFNLVNFYNNTLFVVQISDAFFKSSCNDSGNCFQKLIDISILYSSVPVTITSFPSLSQSRFL